MRCVRHFGCSYDHTKATQDFANNERIGNILIMPDYDKLEEHGPHKRHFRDHFVSENKDFDYFAYDLKLNF